MKTELNTSRRKLLVWTAPSIVAVTLPVHAQMSMCEAPPIATVLAPPKCAGDPPIGTAEIQILAPDAIPMEILSIVATSSDPASVINNLPTAPVMITTTSGVTIEWNGPASDAVTCLPLAEISIAIEYACGNSAALTETINITDLLIGSI